MIKHVGKDLGQDGQSASLNVMFAVPLSQYGIFLGGSYGKTGAFHLYSKRTVHQDMLRFVLYILPFVHCILFFSREGVAHTQMTEWMPMALCKTNHDLFASSFFHGTLLDAIGLQKHNYMVKQLQMKGICFNAKSYAFLATSP